ncbi:hypothetical protein BG004_003915 [Podila humilis]|nr:hypothetical protein BG004_003915 [Podila humilis]
MRDLTETSPTNTRTDGHLRQTNTGRTPGIRISSISNQLKSLVSAPSSPTSSYTLSNSSPTSPSSPSSAFARLQSRFEPSSSSIASPPSFLCPSSSSSSISFTSHSSSISESRPSTSMSQYSSPSLNTVASKSTSASATMTPAPSINARRLSGPAHPLAIVCTLDANSRHQNAGNPVAESTQASPRTLDLSTTTCVAADTKSHFIFTSLEPKEDNHFRQSERTNPSAKSTLVLQIKQEHRQQQTENHADDTSLLHASKNDASDHTGVTMASDSDFPISPLMAAHPTSFGLLLETNTSPKATEEDSHADTLMENSRNRAPSAPEPVAAANTARPSQPSPRAPEPVQERKCEMWVPPAAGPRPSRPDVQRTNQLRQPHGRLHFRRLLKQRSFNLPFHFTTSGSGPSSNHTTGPGASLPAGRASVDGSSRSESSSRSSAHPTRGAASCDIPRSIGPPDPIPPYYQHLQARQQNRRSSSFRRRSHGDELERFAPGWIVNERLNNDGNNTASTSPRVSVQVEHNEQGQRTSASRRHLSLGAQSSIWGRLLTSIFPSDRSEGGSESDAGGAHGRESIDGTSTTDVALQQQRLLFAQSTNQQQAGHPLFQQQLFFYADEIPDLTQVEFPSERAAEENEDGMAIVEQWGSLDLIGSSGGSRPSTPHGLEATAGPIRPIEPIAKIPVSSLALSSPPSYWEAAVKYKGWPKIDPRPEEGKEALPRYSCTVFREGCVNRKTEMVGNWRPYRRPWKRTFAHLRGTSLRLYAVDMEDVPRLHVRNISLQMARCEIAADYKQRSNVIRIRACDRTILLECKDRIDTLTWIEHLQAAANIATSLEDRNMPKFHTLPRSQPSRPSTTTTRRRSSSSRNQTTSSSNGSFNSSTPPQQQQQQQQQLQQQQQQQSQQQEQEQQHQNHPQARQGLILPVHQVSSRQQPEQQQSQQQLIEQQEQIQQPGSSSTASVLVSRSSLMSSAGEDTNCTNHHVSSSLLSVSNGSRRTGFRFGRGSSSLSTTHSSSLQVNSSRSRRSHRRGPFTRPQLARTTSDEERHLDATRFEDDRVVRSVLYALGNSGSESEGSQEESDDYEAEEREEEEEEEQSQEQVEEDEDDGDNDEDDGQGTDVELGNERQLSSQHCRPTHTSSRRRHIELDAPPLSSNSQLQEFHPQLDSQNQQELQEQQQQQQQKQRVGWNRSLRIFGNLWHSHQHQQHHPSGHQQPCQSTMALSASP